MPNCWKTIRYAPVLRDVVLSFAPHVPIVFDKKVATSPDYISLRWGLGKVEPPEKKHTGRIEVMFNPLLKPPILFFKNSTAKKRFTKINNYFCA